MKILYFFCNAFYKSKCKSDQIPMYIYKEQGEHLNNLNNQQIIKFVRAGSVLGI